MEYRSKNLNIQSEKTTRRKQNSYLYIFCADKDLPKNDFKSKNSGG